MWIRILICSKDKVYVKRFSSYIDCEYGDKVETNFIENIEEALSYLHKSEADIFLIDEEFQLQVEQELSKRKIDCQYRILADKLYESDIGGKRVFKYQRGDRLYQHLLEIYLQSGKVRIVHQSGKEVDEGKIYAFISPQGGTGTTTLAKAFAKRQANYDKVFYLNLQFSNTIWKHEANQSGLDEIILALKSRRNILPVKLQSTVLKNRERVFLFAPCSNPVELLELTPEDVRQLINTIKDSNTYNKIVLDIGNQIGSKEIELMKMADRLICVIDNDESGIEIFERFVSLMKALQKREQYPFIRKMELFKNKVVKHIDSIYDAHGIRTGGWTPYLPPDGIEDLIDRIACSDSFAKLEVGNGEESKR